MLEVADPLGYAAGRFRLEGDVDGAEVTSTDADPDLTLDAAALGAAYLGGTKIAALADAGLDRATPRRSGGPTSCSDGTGPLGSPGSSDRSQVASD